MNKCLCDYGCGQEGKFYFKYAKKWCCSKWTQQCPNLRNKTSKSLKGKTFSHMIGKNNNHWKGGIDSGENHKKAWKLFGKDYCENCGINNKDHKLKYRGYRLEMHNTLLPKDHTIMKSEVWMTLCKSCHASLEAKLKR